MVLKIARFFRFNKPPKRGQFVRLFQSVQIPDDFDD
jgi:hypothetical protein